MIEAEGSGEEAANSDESTTNTQEVPPANSDVAIADNNKILEEHDAEDLGWPIAFRKGIRSCRKRVDYPLSHYVSYEKISLEYKTFLIELDNTSVPKTVNEALASKDWKQAIDEEMMALKKNRTWDLTPLSKEKKLVGCRWVYTQKFYANGKLERCKARLVAEGYT